MGAIRAAANRIVGNDDEVAKERALLDALASLAEEKGRAMTQQILADLRTAGTAENRTVPIESILAIAEQHHAYAKEGLDANISENVSSALRGFCSGSADSIINGVTSLISTALSAFLGAGEASEDSLHQYYLLTEGMSIIRIDLRSWRRKIAVAGLKSNVESVSAFSAVKSTVDLSKVHLNTFLYMYERQLAAVFDTNSMPFIQQIETTKQIYMKFAETLGSPASA
ncbi:MULTISPECIES: hypothetical protein [unclassified Solwaraspora]|uniref:hypothetical protein n=1 Tax=unclassified Solwaraspora TaxID=2627926 RepID=UPI00259BDE2B|nr:hypothetical protein [Solwaraspora sp. WMMA2056]WJK38175.1 hypothetical protein O7608_16795 [Solwaraspora sp. WMMA2056]